MSEYSDDTTILDEWNLLRRVKSDRFTFDVNLDRSRPSTDSFKDSSDNSPMSAFLLEKHLSLGLGKNDILNHHLDYKIVYFTVKLARTLGLLVVHDPLPDAPAHVLVVGEKKSSVIKGLARNCVVLDDQLELSAISLSVE